MAEPNLFDQMTYSVGQSARVAWYTAHYLAARRISTPEARASNQEPKPVRSKRSRSDGQYLGRALREVFEQDWANVKAGYYAKPNSVTGSPLRLFADSRRFLRDVPKVDRRRFEHSHSEVLSPELKDRYPRYYLQNFHYQTDGYLSEESAKLYDFQVETLFTGAADAMRRQALVPLYHAMKGRDQRKVSLLDVACGTGSFLTFVKDNYPRLPVAGLDLSPDYLEIARKRLRLWRDTDLIHGSAESIPCDDSSMDIVTDIYLFHELPPRVRESVAKEFARVLKTGGKLIHVDTVQLGDDERMDGLLEMFPVSFHEPYYGSYIKTDLDKLFGDTGLVNVSHSHSFLTKVSVYEKQA